MVKKQFINFISHFFMSLEVQHPLRHPIQLIDKFFSGSKFDSINEAIVNNILTQT